MLGEVIRQIIDWIRILPPTDIYVVFFLIAYFENIVPPIPGDVLVAFAGYLAAESVISLGPVFVLTTTASVFGFMSVYGLGRHWGKQIEKQQTDFWLVRFISLQYIRKVRSWMSRWGQGVIVANRFLAGTRSVISLAAGIGKTKISWTIISSAISSVLWNAILLGFGWFVHSNWQRIGRYLSIYGKSVFSLILFMILIRAGFYFYRKRAVI